ncbi:hypothetical protein OF83DRAFT_1063497, partial [Amylostereum chailletii]
VVSDSMRMQTCLLVGGFAANEYLYAELQDYLLDQGLTPFRPDNHTMKAVVEGAVSFYIDHYVSSRVAKMSYGTYYRTVFNPAKPDHRKRIQNAYMDVDGRVAIKGRFSCMILRVSGSNLPVCREPVLIFSGDAGR